MGRRGYGHGSLKARSRLIKGCQVRTYVAEWTDARGKRHRADFGANRQEAERRLTKVIRDRDLELAGLKHEEGLDVSLDELVDDYLADVKVRATERSYECRSDSLTRFRKDTGVRFVREVTPQLVQTFLRQRLAAGRSPRTVNNDLLALKACLNHAVRAHRIASNPIALVRPLPFRGKERRLPRALTDEECSKLLGVAVAADRGSVEPRPLLLRTLIETGARWGELTATTWGDLRWEPGELRLRSETTKNRTERVIPVGPALLRLLRKRAQRDAGQGDPRPEGLIFRSPWCHAWGLSHNFRDWLDEMLEAAGIARKDSQGRVVNVHALRHTFATRLARAGVPLQQAAYLTGHRTLAVLMQIYTHLQAEDTRAAITRLALPDIEHGNIPAVPRRVRSHTSRSKRCKFSSRSSLELVGRTGFEPVTSTL